MEVGLTGRDRKGDMALMVMKPAPSVEATFQLALPPTMLLLVAPAAVEYLDPQESAITVREVRDTVVVGETVARHLMAQMDK